METQLFDLKAVFYSRMSRVKTKWCILFSVIAENGGVIPVWWTDLLVRHFPIRERLFIFSVINRVMF